MISYPANPVAASESGPEWLADRKRAVCSADDGACAARMAAVEQQLAVTAEQQVGLPLVDGQAAGAKDRAGVERHGQQLPRVHGGEFGVAAGGWGRGDVVGCNARCTSFIDPHSR